jgi:hypothetical protein
MLFLQESAVQFGSHFFPGTQFATICLCDATFYRCLRFIRMCVFEFQGFERLSKKSVSVLVLAGLQLAVEESFGGGADGNVHGGRSSDSRVL